MICENLKLIANEYGGYNYFCKLTSDITNPNSCYECIYFPKEDNQELNAQNKGLFYDRF